MVLSQTYYKGFVKEIKKDNTTCNIMVYGRYLTKTPITKYGTMAYNKNIVSFVLLNNTHR